METEEKLWIKILSKLAWPRDPSPIGKQLFRKRLALLLASALFLNLVLIYLYQYSNEVHSIGIYYSSLLLLLFTNITCPIILNFIVYDRIEDSMGNSKSLRGFGLSLLVLLPWVGLFFIYTLATKDKIPKGYFKKSTLQLLILTSLVLIPFRYQEKVLSNPQSNSPIISNIARALLYDHSPMSLRYILNTVNEASIVFSLRQANGGEITDCKNVTSEKKSDDQWTCLLEQFEHLSDIGPRKTSTFYVLATAVDAMRIFKEKEIRSGLVDNDKEKSKNSIEVALQLIENQSRIRRLVNTQKKSFLSYLSPYLIYLPGSPEAVVLFLTEELIQIEFDKIMFKKLDGLRESVSKTVEKGEHLSPQEQAFYRERIKSLKIFQDNLRAKSKYWITSQ